jgi:hypothetical protein
MYNKSECKLKILKFIKECQIKTNLVIAKRALNLRRKFKRLWKQLNVKY